ncbi:1-deoxy-D-xylulose-5-phosphate synthase [Actinoplanes sp. TBRC 11911]|uniref:1-deoxy-D-xylulose-5-phosphate synthase n=1 Tax=Actinoplanes sp. TBRC 11911 TaxID=2729386 RepID=UPI00145E9F41|nr:1-deoxy-D-xylulose-5-phosphate synthase [Actinoplanes sp. TBRC 11911]NMO51121.1 1-deoxy-D-xylulose-5-phosphate synthase [Actinoplanes sp. TBRC 11911]
MTLQITPPVNLEMVNCPSDVRALPVDALPVLAAQIRRRLIDTVSRTGGHLGPNLGVVELTIALHRVFDSPRDAIVWDTGHQAYVHKMLTGRVSALSSLRQAGGLSGYPRRAESPHDLVENSHASTALSYADGLAKAFALQDAPDRAVVAVVGDGAMTGGMCWEALNNIGACSERPVIVVLNDNGRSYSPTVGSAHSALPSLLSDLGLSYIGPIDGHDVGAVSAALVSARSLKRPVVVHVLTVKGKGYPAAEAEEYDRMHAISPPPSSSASVSAPARVSWTSVFGSALVQLAASRPDLVAVTAAMLHPTGLGEFASAYPSRIFDVGIAEQHAVTSAAGLAMGGMHPVVCVYATFLNRAFDQLLMDVALHRLPVTFVLDRAGVTGSDGPSHNGMWDLSLLAIVPGVRVAAPRDGETLRRLLAEAVSFEGPAVLRFPKADVGAPLPAIDHIGESDVLFSSPDASVLMLATGPLAGAALEAARELELDGIAVTVVDPRWVLPLAPELVEAVAGHRLTVTIEDGGVAGGFGASVIRACPGSRVEVLGLDQEFMDHGSRGALLASQGLDAAGIAAAVRRAY